MKAISILGLASLLACGASTDDFAAGSSTGAGSSAVPDVAAPDLPPARPSWRAVSAGFTRLCAIREPEGTIVCRDPACDAGQRPDDWALDDAACWIAPALPAGQYAQVDAAAADLVTGTGHVCGLTIDGAIACDPPVALPDDVYTAIGSDNGLVCGLGSNGAACDTSSATSSVSVPAATALDRGALLVPDGAMWFFGSDVQLPGDFVAATGAYFNLCAQRTGGGWTCTNPAHAEAIAARGRLDAVELAMYAGEEAHGCGLDPAGHARCWGRLDDREGPFVQLSVAAIPGVPFDGEAGIPYACAVREDGSLTCWGALEGWCGDSLCTTTHYCDAGVCRPCGEGGCDACGELTCSNGEHCVEPGECRDCAGGSCHACECAADDPFCDVELSLCLCGTQCDAGVCRYACGPAQLTCATTFGCADGPPVSGECVDGWCIE